MNFSEFSALFALIIHSHSTTNSRSLRSWPGNLERIFMNTGRFRSYSDAAHLKSGNLSTRGGIYLAPDAHVAMVLSNSDMITDEPLASPAPSIAPPYVEV